MPRNALTEAEQAELESRFDGADLDDMAAVREARADADKLEESAGGVDDALMDDEDGGASDDEAEDDDDGMETRPTWSSRRTAPRPAIGVGSGTRGKPQSLHKWGAPGTFKGALASSLNAHWDTDFFEQSVLGMIATVYIAVVLLEVSVVREILRHYTMAVMEERAAEEGAEWFEDRDKLAALIVLAAALKRDQSRRPLPDLSSFGGTTFETLIDVIVVANAGLAPHRQRLEALSEETLMATIGDTWAAVRGLGNVPTNIVEARHIRRNLTIELLEAVERCRERPPLTDFPVFDQHWAPFAKEYAASWRLAHKINVIRRLINAVRHRVNRLLKPAETAPKVTLGLLRTRLVHALVRYIATTPRRTSHDDGIASPEPVAYARLSTIAHAFGFVPWTTYILNGSVAIFGELFAVIEAEIVVNATATPEAATATLRDCLVGKHGLTPDALVRVSHSLALEVQRIKGEPLHGMAMVRSSRADCR